MWKFPILCAIVLANQLFAAGEIMRGKVTLADGSPPGQRVLIERVCQGLVIQDAITGKQGEYFWRVPGQMAGGNRRSSYRLPIRCILRARLKDTESNYLDIEDLRVLRNLQLPTLVLGRSAPPSNAAKLPPAVARSWELAVKSFAVEKWAESERLAAEVARQAPTFAPAWDVLGLARQRQRKATAREAFLRAVAADPQALAMRLHLARVESSSQLWPEAAKSAEALIRSDTASRYPEAHLLLGIARLMTHDTEAARSSFQTFLERAPNSPNAANVRTQLEELSRSGGASEPSLSVQQALLVRAPEPEFTVGGEAWVPAGRKALGAIARLGGAPGAGDFFLEYCRAIAAQTWPQTEHPIPGYMGALRESIRAITELVDIGERKEDRVSLTISLSDPKAPRILAALGWKIVPKNGARIEPGDQPADGPRQRIPAALGIDESD